MILKSKICGISDSRTLDYLVSHNYPPQFIGFIVNYPKSKRHVEKKILKKLLEIDKKKSLYVAVLVNPEKNFLEEIKDLPFDYYQLYNCTSAQIQFIKKKYKKKIILGESNHQSFCPDPDAFDDCKDQLIGLEPRKANGALHGQHVAAALVLLRMEQAADEDHA